jgi:hypothetical protein
MGTGIFARKGNFSVHVCQLRQSFYSTQKQDRKVTVQPCKRKTVVMCRVVKNTFLKRRCELNNPASLKRVTQFPCVRQAACTVSRRTRRSKLWVRVGQACPHPAPKS